MENFLFPWQAHVMQNHPLAMPIFLLVLANLMAIITWIRQKKK